ncbi:trichohyalin-like [Myzus persicae]|uniref:trichohyalin-like n=1 Tax=Myzus persicae TaxID=13164 RepID=UPI000B92FFC6|nr:trichohyalin-like [Myzus persicae]
MQNQPKNKNLKNQSLVEKRNQQQMQQALQLEIRRQRQEIHLNNEIIHKQVKQIRREQRELEKQQQKIKEENRQLERKLLQENEQKMNDNPSPATNDIAVAPTELAMAAAATDSQPSSQSRRDNIAAVDVSEKQVCVDNIQNDLLRAEQGKEQGAEFQKVERRRRRKKIDELLKTPIQVTQVTHELPVVEATDITSKDLTEVRDSIGNSQNELNEDHEAIFGALITEHDPETSSICAEKKNQNNKKIKNKKMSQELEQQLLKGELRRQRQEIQLNKEMIQRQEKQKRREKQQELEKQQILKKEEKRQQLERRRLDKLSQRQTATPATNDIASASTKSVKAESIIYNQPPGHSLENNKTEVDVTNKQICAENDVLLKSSQAVEDKAMEDQEMNQHLRVELDNVPQTLTTQITSFAHEIDESDVVEDTINRPHIEDLKALLDSVRDLKFLECSEKNVNCDFKNEQLCEKHDTAISSLRKEFDDILAKYTNVWTDIDFDVMVDEVRVECENDSLQVIEKLKKDHEEEVKNLHIYYSSRIHDIHVNNQTLINTIQRSHDSSVFHLRNLNYNQGVRQEAALRSMRELKEKTRKEHEIAIKGLIEEKELLCTEHERVVRELQEINQSLRMEIETITKIHLPSKCETVIKMVRNKDDSLVVITSPDLTLQNGTVPTEVERLQCQLAGEDQQRSIVVAHQQTTNGDDNNDSDTTTSTIDDSDELDMIKSQDTTSPNTLEDYEQIFYETAEKLSLLHRYVSRNESNCSSQEDDLQQQDDLEVDAHSPQNSHSNSKDED